MSRSQDNLAPVTKIPNSRHANLFKVFVRFEPVNHVFCDAATNCHRQLYCPSNGEGMDETTRHEFYNFHQSRWLSELTAFQSSANPAPGGHLTSKGSYCPPDRQCVPFTTESYTPTRPGVVNTPLTWVARRFPRHCFPPCHSDCWLMSWADISNPLTVKITNNAGIVC